MSNLQKLVHKTTLTISPIPKPTHSQNNAIANADSAIELARPDIRHQQYAPNDDRINWIIAVVSLIFKIPVLIRICETWIYRNLKRNRNFEPLPAFLQTLQAVLLIF